MTAAVYDESEAAVMRRERQSSSPIRSHQGVLKSISWAKMAIVLLLTITSTMLAGTPTALATGTSPSLLILEHGTSTPASLLDTRAAEMPIGSPCYASEGEWNCLTTSFQRCASGQWSEITDTADGASRTVAQLRASIRESSHYLVNIPRIFGTMLYDRLFDDGVLCDDILCDGNLCDSILCASIFDDVLGMLFYDGLSNDGIIYDCMLDGALQGTLSASNDRRAEGFF